MLWEVIGFELNFMTSVCICYYNGNNINYINNIYGLGGCVGDRMMKIYISIKKK